MIEAHFLFSCFLFLVVPYFRIELMHSGGVIGQKVLSPFIFYMFYLFIKSWEQVLGCIELFFFFPAYCCLIWSQTAKGAKVYSAAVAATVDSQHGGKEGEEKIKLHTHSYCCLDYAQVAIFIYFHSLLFPILFCIE